MREVFGYVLVVLITSAATHLITRGATWLRK